MQPSSQWKEVSLSERIYEWEQNKMGKLIRPITVQMN